MSGKEPATGTTGDATSEADIATWLDAHPDFFLRHPELLTRLEFPHDTGGGAVSLIERQVALLRQQKRTVEERLNQLVATARENERLLDRFQKLLCELIQTESLHECVTRLERGFVSTFEIDLCRLYLFSECGAHPPAETLDKRIEVEVRAFLGSGSVVSGKLPGEIGSVLLAEHPDIASTALLYLNARDYRAVLLLGSRDPEHYRTNMSTSFLRYMASALTAVVGKYLAAG